MEKKFVAEGDPILLEWAGRAGTITTKEQLSDFIEELMNCYSHDQSTVCHAVVAIALASISTANAYPEGGIKGWQPNMIVGLFLRHFLRLEGPTKVMSWAGLLHAGNGAAYGSVPDQVFVWVQNQAKMMLDGDLRGVPMAQLEHLKKIVDGEIPFGFKLESEFK